MAMKVLVAYATKYGATTEIAEKIGEVLTQVGLDIDVLPANQVKDLTPYQAVVLGSAVYIGRWRKEAVRFLKRHEAALTERATWFFSSGPTDEGDPVELLEGWEFPSGQQEIADRIQPRDITVFHGALAMENLNAFNRKMLEMAEVPSGDFRDWEVIAAWAQGIAASLKEPA